MAVTRRFIEFERLDTKEVEDALASLPDGAWINIEPIIEADVAPLRAFGPPALEEEAGDESQVA